MGIPAGYEKLATIGIAYKNDYDPAKEYKFLNAVYYSGSTYVSLKDNPAGPPVDDKVNWQYMAKGFVEGVMSAINAIDTGGVVGDAGETVNAQTLIDAISDRVMTKLVATNKIVTNFLATDPTTVAAGTTVKELMDKYTQLNGDLESNWIDLTPYLVNGWEDNGGCAAKKNGNHYIIRLSARNGTAASNTKIMDNLPFAAFGVCANCFYAAVNSGEAIQMRGHSITLAGNAPGNSIFATFAAQIS